MPLAATERERSDRRLRQGLRALAHELTLAETRERERIARDLHDELGQLLVVARMKLHALRSSPSADQNLRIDELGQLLEQASRATRSATFDLSSTALNQGLTEALAELAERLARLGPARFHFEGGLPERNWSQPVLTVMYRVARELAVNAQRHARARQVWMRLKTDRQHVLLTVSDDGVGIDAEWAHRGLRRDGGFGLVSSHAQVQALGGTLVVESAPGSGTLATVSLPLDMAIQA